MKTTLQDPPSLLGQAAGRPPLPRLDHILVPVDFSKASLDAVEAAVALLKGNDSARLTLLHVVQPMPAFAMADAGIPPAIDPEALVGAATAEMKRIGKSYGDEVKTTVKVVVGSPAHEIVQLGGSGDFELIVMSSHGRSGVRRLLLGSVAEAVIHGSHSSVLVVKVPPGKDGKPVPRFRPRSLRKIVVGYDGRPGAGAAAAMAEQVAHRTGARLTLVHALPPSAVANYELQCDTALERLAEVGVSGECLSRRRAFMAKCGDPWEVLGDAARDLDADLVVVGPHEHFHRNFEFLGSTAQRLIRLSPCSVLAVK